MYDKFSDNSLKNSINILNIFRKMSDAIQKSTLKKSKQQAVKRNGPITRKQSREKMPDIDLLQLSSKKGLLAELNVVSWLCVFMAIRLLVSFNFSSNGKA